MQLSASVFDRKLELNKSHPLLSPSNPGFVNLFEELFWRHLHIFAPSQNPLVPQVVLLGEGLPPPHDPFDWHVLLMTHISLSLHDDPVLTVTMHPVEVEHEAAWHWSAPGQLTAEPPPHDPFDWHVSFMRHLLPVMHDPVLTGAEEQPVAGTQVGVEWHWSAPGQLTAAPPPHDPFDWHVSPVRHLLPVMQDAPVAITHIPLAVEHGLQVPQAEPEICHVPFASQS